MLFSKKIRIISQFSNQLKKKLKAKQGLQLKQKIIYTQQQLHKYYSLYQINPILQDKNKQVDSMLLSTIFSAIIGSNLDLSVYLSQKIQIIKNVKIGQQITGIVQIQKYLGKNKYKLRTQAFNSKGELFVTGHAQILQQ